MKSPHGERRRWRRGLVLLALATGMLVTSARAVEASDLETLSRRLGRTPAPEAPAAVSELVSAAAPADQAAVATTVVIAAARFHPATVGPCVLAAVRAAPQVADAVILAASEARPECLRSLVSTAAAADSPAGDRIIISAERLFPGRAAALEREVAVVRARQLLGDRIFLVTPRALPRQPLPEPSPTREPDAGSPR
ncbi:MAG: hypothetical protein KF791_04285 [Verrucomicrobiae bacterium]|nr:hypothetical protein [Verrucomicrobiae bacterium]